MTSVHSISYDDICRKLYAALVECTKIPAEWIINSDSIEGPNVFKTLAISTVGSPSLSDAFIVFDLTERDEDIGSDDNDGLVDNYNPYTFHLRIYGRASHSLAVKIRSHFRSAFVCGNLINDGVYIAGVKPTTNMNEFINGHLWPRCDIIMNVDTHELVETEPVPDGESYSGNINIISYKGD